MPRTIKVKPLATIEKNYREAASRAAAEYTRVADTVVWKDPALKGQALYEEMMRRADVLARRLAGIEKVTDSEFREAMKKKGAPVLASRMRDAAPKQAAGYRPIREALDGLEIPDKTPDWEANVDAILKLVIRTMKEAAGKE